MSAFWGCSHAAPKMPATISSSAHGMRGEMRGPTKTTDIATTPIATVQGFASVIWLIVLVSLGNNSLDFGVTPSRWGSSDTITRIDKPMVNPVITGREMRSVIQPVRRTPAIVSRTPDATATAQVSATARAGSIPPPMICTTTAPDMMATVDVGPTETWRDDENTAYTSSAAGNAYSPTCTGTPATVA